MSTLETQYKNYKLENPHSIYTFEEWMDNVLKPKFEKMNKNNNEK